MIAVFGWALAFAAVSGLVIHDPINRSVCPRYAAPCNDWLNSRGLYDQNTGIDGFLYAPQAGLIYMPFALAGDRVGGIAWRAVGLLIFCAGLWLWAKSLWPDRALMVFAIASAVAFWPSLASLRCGQSNLHIGGIMLMAAYCLHRGKWWGAGVWLIVGLAVKPIILVMVLLAAVVYPVILFPLIVSGVVAVLFPFVTQRPHYVIAQYRAFVSMLRTASQPDRYFQDIRGLLWKTHWVMPLGMYSALQFVAAAMTAVLCIYAAWKWNSIARAFFLMALAACYLMLFNPRTESNSFVIVVPAMALPAAMLLIQHRSSGWVLASFGFFLAGDGWAYHLTHYWLKALTTLVFLVILIREIFNRQPSPWFESVSDVRRGFEVATNQLA